MTPVIVDQMGGTEELGLLLEYRRLGKAMLTLQGLTQVGRRRIELVYRFSSTIRLGGGSA